MRIKDDVRFMLFLSVLMLLLYMVFKAGQYNAIKFLGV